jgi:hypothetical protein
MTIVSSILKTSLTTGVAAVVALGLVIGSTSAEAADSCQWGTCGPHLGLGGVGPQVKCNGVGNTNPDNTMSVETPDIRAVSVYRLGYAGGPMNVQWVAYRATLQRYNGTSFVKALYPEQPWVSWSANSANDNSGYPSLARDYWEWHQNQWTLSTSGGRTFFTNLPVGAYRVSIEYYWFADPEDGLGAGYDVLPSERNDYVGMTSLYSDVHPGYCDYGNDPGGHPTWTFGG